MKEEALQQAKQLYRDLHKHFSNSPKKIAFAMGFITNESSLKDRRNACAKIGMWKKNGVAKDYIDKAKEFISM